MLQYDDSDFIIRNLAQAYNAYERFVETGKDSWMQVAIYFEEQASIGLDLLSVNQ